MSRETNKLEVGEERGGRVTGEECERKGERRRQKKRNRETGSKGKMQGEK